MKETVHVPVMMKEAIELLQLKKGMTVFDATLGGGGYTLEMYKYIMPGGRLICCDRDKRAIERFKKKFPEIAKNIEIVHLNYSNIRKILKILKISHIDAIVADLGLSSDQIEETDRGFSFSDTGRLDMRMNKSSELTAWHVINEFTQDDLIKLIFEYGDEKFAHKIVKEICAHRPIFSAKDLSNIIVEAIPNNVQRKMKIHPATKTFQAIRIIVNDEFEHLKIFLTDGIELLQRSGYFSVVSFHSGEDRIVKNIFRANARGCICDVDMPVCRCNNKPKVQIITKKPLVPSSEEIHNNPRSRSAKLRCVQKK
jgi:16S rRNA (cytosine1402-N4)-methyltransferase